MATKKVEGSDPQRISTLHQRRMEAKRLLANEKFESSFQNTMFKTVSISTIMAKMRYAHALAGIIMETGAFRNLQKTVFKNTVGKELIQYTAEVPIILVNPDDPEDRWESEISASATGIEADDKWNSKLYSSATKIFARMEYAISDVSDKEIDIDAVADYDALTTKPTENYEGSVPKSTFEMTQTDEKVQTESVKNETVKTASEQADEAIQKYKPADSKLRIHVVPKENIEEVK